MEYLSFNNLRTDGRRPTETRKIDCKLGVVENANGSAFFKFGQTLVVTSINGPRESSFHYKFPPDRADIVCHWKTGNSAKPQHSGKRSFNKKNREREDFMARTVEGIIFDNLLKKTVIEINIEFFQCDGGLKYDFDF
ncbi:hypothetical protein MHBO_004385 [Bonamia ostreae]|uniref:Exoribonuclease phosphorolytic domain-containing protein n=1 Tax=Bonamia ostreae TaxID=126728 RepID=A0ABV2ATW0_9EUKA